MSEFVLHAGESTDLGIIDLDKKTYFSFCSSMTISKAYQHTIFKHMKLGFKALQFASDAIFNSETNPRTLKCVNNINNKLKLLKNEQIKSFNLAAPLAQQYAHVINPLVSLIDTVHNVDNTYLQLEQQIQDGDAHDEQPSQDDADDEEEPSLHLQLEQDQLPEPPVNSSQNSAPRKPADVTKQTKKKVNR